MQLRSTVPDSVPCDVLQAMRCGTHATRGATRMCSEGVRCLRSHVFALASVFFVAHHACHLTHTERHEHAHLTHTERHERAHLTHTERHEHAHLTHTERHERAHLTHTERHEHAHRAPHARHEHGRRAPRMTRHNAARDARRDLRECCALSGREVARVGIACEMTRTKSACFTAFPDDQSIL